VEQKEVVFRVDQDGNAMELSFESWRAFCATMRKMGPLWSQADSLVSLMRQVESVIPNAKP